MYFYRIEFSRLLLCGCVLIYGGYFGGLFNRVCDLRGFTPVKAISMVSNFVRLATLSGLLLDCLSLPVVALKLLLMNLRACIWGVFTLGCLSKSYTLLGQNSCTTVSLASLFGWKTSVSGLPDLRPLEGMLWFDSRISIVWCLPTSKRFGKS